MSTMSRRSWSRAFVLSFWDSASSITTIPTAVSARYASFHLSPWFSRHFCFVCLFFFFKIIIVFINFIIVIIIIVVVAIIWRFLGGFRWASSGRYFVMVSRCFPSFLLAAWLPLFPLFRDFSSTFQEP